MVERRQYSRAEIVSMAIATAERHDLVPVEFLGGIIAEGFNVYAERPARREDWRRYWEPPEPLFDVSFGLGQKNARYSEPYQRWCEAHGIDYYGSQADAYPGDDAIAEIRERFFDPAYALDVAAKGYRYWRYDPPVEPLHAWSAYNGPVYYKQRPWQSNPNVGNYRDGLAEAERILKERAVGPKQLRVTEDNVRLRERPDLQAPVLYQARAGELVTPLSEHSWRQVRAGGTDGWMAAKYLEGAESEQSDRRIAVSPPRLQFDPHTPTELQRQDWTCSIRATMWMLKSLGIAVTPEEAQDAMSPRYVTPDVGLLDASGAGIVEVLRDRWGVGAVNNAAATFDDVLAVAGRQPVAVGLRNWGGPHKGHWTAVRGWDGPPGAERLLLANPGGTGAVYGQQTLNREQFDARGPASMVVIPLGA